MKVLHRLVSFRASLILTALYAVLLAAATWIEKKAGTSAAFSAVYHAPWFLLLQALMVFSFLGAVWRSRYEWKKRWSFLITHFALLVILSGATVSFFWSEEGVLHLREGETGYTFVMRKGAEMTERRLPFEVRLDDFRVTRYPGSMSPASFESDVTVFHDGKEIRAGIYMNHVLDVGQYRLFQTSYDSDECGSVLTVSHDAIGRRVTYTGYFLLAVGLLGIFLDPWSRFRRQGRRLRRLQALGGLLLVVAGARAAAPPVELPDFLRNHTVPAAHAERFGALPVQSQSGRIMPVNTFAREILRKLARTETVAGLTPEQFLLSLYTWSGYWSEVALLDLPDGQMAARYGLAGSGRCAFSQLFRADGSYKLQADLEKALAKAPAERTRFDKELIKLDERANTFYALTAQRLMRIFPCETVAGSSWYAPGDDLSSFSGQDSMFVSRIFVWYLSAAEEAALSGNTGEADNVLDMISTYQKAKGGDAYDAARIELELRYNGLQPFRTSRIGYLTLGALLLAAAFLHLFRPYRSFRTVTWILFAGILSVFLFHMYGMSMRWRISGYAPWSNAYETMVYVAWATTLAGLFFVRRSSVVTALATLLGGVMLFVSGLNWMDPQITPLVPVLRSVWLLFHVAVVVAAYGLLGLGCLLGLVNLLMLGPGRGSWAGSRLSRVRELTLVNERILWMGLALLAAGIFLGAIWANESWGSYWGWDPKETWALITMLVYVLVTHLHLLCRKNYLWWFNLAAFVAFAAVLMTFFGVNYWLSGMHSYA